MKIGTHDSGTGEKGKGLISFLVTPFSKTQGKTLQEQYESGCRLFDIRLRYIKGAWRCAHGLWYTKKTAEEIFEELNSFPEQVIVQITYEGKGKKKEEFIDFVHYLKLKYPLVLYGNISIKYGKDSTGIKVKYETLEKAEYPVKAVQGFLPLDGRSWHTYLPIPWLWKKLYHNKPEFNDEYYTWVDFL